MNRNLILVCAAALVLVVLLALRAGRPPKIPTPPQGAPPEVAMAGNEHLPVRAAAAALPTEPDPDQRRQRAEAARESFRDGAPGAPLEDPEPEQFDISRAQEGGFAQRVERHIGMQQYMNSPARGTPEFQEIAEICRRFNYEPWVVPAVYNLAYDMNRELRVLEETDPGGAENASAREILRAYLQRQGAELTRRLGVDIDPAFLEAIRGIRPTEFVGQRPLLRNGEPLVDNLGWDAVDQWQQQQHQQGP